MSRPATSWRPSSEEPAIANPSTPQGCRSSLWFVARFGLSTILIAIVLSLLALPFVNLPWWNVFRRCVSIGAALSVWIGIRMVQHRTFRSYGFSNPAAGKRQLLFGLLLGAGTLLILLALGLATGACRVQITPDEFKLWRTILGFIPAAALVSVLEELVFRGVILQPLLSCSTPVAVIASSALYSVVHLKTTTISLSTCLELGGLFILGAVLSLSYLRTRQLYLAVGLHAILAYAARVNKLLIQFPEPSAYWLVGTSRIVNGLVGWLALLAMGWMIILWTKGLEQGGVRHANST